MFSSLIILAPMSSLNAPDLILIWKLGTIAAVVWLSVEYLLFIASFKLQELAITDSATKGLFLTKNLRLNYNRTFIQSFSTVTCWLSFSLI